MKYKVSVIIPVYGVEKFIERCARSLFEQTLDDIEYVFVDDCTKDSSINILRQVLKDYPSREKDVRILKHEINKGLPQARKTGVLAASGDYIAHCDSDDWVSVEMYDTLYNNAITDNLDIVWCDYYMSDGACKTYVQTGQQSLLMTGPVWNKLVKRSIYIENEIMYPVANKAEDGALMAQLSFFAKTRGYVQQSLYYYYQNPDSMCRAQSVESCLTRFRQDVENTDLRIEFLLKHNSLDKFKSDVLIWKCVARDELLPLVGKKEYYQLWYKTYPEINKEFFFDKGISIRKKIGFMARLIKLYNRKVRII